MRLAAKWGLPVVTLVDTPGAYPGVDGRGAGAGDRDRGEPAADGLAAGAGGHGGHRRGLQRRRARASPSPTAVLMMENAIYTVISPGGVRGDPVEATRPPRPPRPGRCASTPARCSNSAWSTGWCPEPRGRRRVRPAPRPPRCCAPRSGAELREHDRSPSRGVPARRFRRVGTARFRPPSAGWATARRTSHAAAAVAACGASQRRPPPTDARLSRRRAPAGCLADGVGRGSGPAKPRRARSSLADGGPPAAPCCGSADAGDRRRAGVDARARTAPPAAGPGAGAAGVRGRHRQATGAGAAAPGAAARRSAARRDRRRHAARPTRRVEGIVPRRTVGTFYRAAGAGRGRRSSPKATRSGAASRSASSRR